VPAVLALYDVARTGITRQYSIGPSGVSIVRTTICVP
jgi:hypothetical protein